MDARVHTNISIEPDTDLNIRVAPGGTTWIEMGSAAIFAPDAQLRRLHAVLTDHLSQRRMVGVARTVESDLHEDR